MAEISILPGTEASARATLAKALEEVQDGDAVFVIAIRGDEAAITASAFKTKEICWASQILNWHALDKVR